MAAVDAANISMKLETKFQDRRAKIFRITHDGSGTSAVITPGQGFVYPIGNYKSYSVTWSTQGGAFTLGFGAATNNTVFDVMFLAG